MKLSNIFAVIVFLTLFLVPAAFTAENTKVNSVEQLDFANGLFQRGLYKMAVDEFSKFIKQFPIDENANKAYFGLAESLFFVKDYRRAVRDFERYVLAYPKDTSVSIAKLRIGESLYTLGEYDRSLAELESIDVDRLNDIFRQDFYYNLGKVYGKTGDFDKALKAFDMSVKIKPDSEISGYSLIEKGDLCLAVSSKDKAVEFFDRAYNSVKSLKVRSLALYKKGEYQYSEKRYSESARTFMKLMNEGPDKDILLNAFTNMLLSLYNAGELNKLTAEYEKSSGIIPEDKESLKIYNVAISAYNDLSEYDKAKDLAGKLISAKWTQAEDKCNLARRKIDIALGSGDFNGSIDLLEQYSEVLSANEDYILHIMAEANYGLGQYTEAKRRYSDLLSRFSDSVYADDAVYGLAYCFKHENEHSKALEMFVKYFDKGTDKARRQEALYNAILLDSLLGNDDAAIKHARVFLDQFPQGHIREKVLFRIGALCSAAGNHDNAIKYLKEYESVSAESGKKDEAVFLLGYSYQSKGVPAEALKWYGLVEQENSRKIYYSAQKNTALLLINQGDNTTAADVFKRLIEDYPNNDLEIDVYFWLAKYYIKNNRFSQACRLIESLSAEKSIGREPEICYFKAEALRGLQEFAKAAGEYTEVLRLEPEGVFAGPSYIGRGISYAEAKEYVKAAEDFAKVVEQYPDDNTLAMKGRFELARVKELSGDNEQAHRLYMLVAILYSDDYYCPEALFLAGCIAEKLGRKNEALAAFQEITVKFKHSHAYDKALKKLKIIK